MPRIAVSGAAGRMGRRILVQTLLHPECELVAAVEAKGHPALGDLRSRARSPPTPSCAIGRRMSVWSARASQRVRLRAFPASRTFVLRGLSIIAALLLLRFVG